MSSEKKWYVHRNNKQEGPYSLEEFGSLSMLGEIQPKDLAWCKGMKEWTPVHSVPELKPFVKAPAAPQQFAPATMAASAPRAAGRSQAPQPLNTSDDELSRLIQRAPRVEESTRQIDRKQLRQAQTEARKAIQKEARATSGARWIWILLLLAAAGGAAYYFLLAKPAQAAPPPPAPAPAQAPAGATPPQPAGAARDASQGEALQIDSLKRKYWERGEATEPRVIQNRQYTKSHKFELGAFVGSLSTDPFLNVHAVGGDLSFHVTEMIGVYGMYWKDLVSDSIALDALEATGTTTNSNRPQSFMAGGIRFSPIYGKISVLGKAIYHYDLHVTAGAGVMATDSGKYFSPFIGIGQAFYLNQFLSLRLDYKFAYYRETLIEKVNPDPTKIGQPAGTHNSFNDVLTLGLSVFLGPVF